MKRTTWTDARLDEFARRVDARFDGVDARFDRVDARFDRMDARFDRVEGGVTALRSEMNQRFDALHTTLIRLGGGAIVGLLGVIAAYSLAG